MRFYTGQHQYYCGIDLHTKNMYICILDQAGKILVHKNISTSPQTLLRIIDPFLPDIAITVECIFTWYWIADLCQEENIPFILGHALYMKAIHGAKTKNDKIDSRKIAVLLRGGMIPMAYCILFQAWAKFLPWCYCMRSMTSTALSAYKTLPHIQD